MDHKHRAQFLRTAAMRQPTMYSYMASHRYLYQIVFTLSGEIGLLDHLWGQNPFSVRRGAEAAQRADRGDTHTTIFTQLRAARMRNTLLLLVWLIWVLALERKKLQ